MVWCVVCVWCVCKTRLHNTQRFARLLIALEGLQRVSHTTASLKALSIELRDVLAECEHSLPIHWCTGVKHYLLHETDKIHKCGPFQEHNMLVFERWHTIFKRLARGRRNVLASIHNHWTLVTSAAAWRLSSQGGGGWVPNGFDSSLAGAVDRDFSLRKATVKGKQMVVELSDEDFAHVQDVWAVQDRDYDKLRDKYRRSIGERLGRGKSQIPEGLVLDRLNRTELASKERSCLLISEKASSADRADFNGLAFCTSHHCNGLQTDDSVVKLFYEEFEDQRRAPAFAWIQRILIHELYPGYTVYLTIIIRPAWHSI